VAKSKRGGVRMKCGKCQSENPEHMKFCGQCGAALERVCRHCGFSNPVGFGFCGQCGQGLGVTESAPPVDYSEPQSYTPRFLADKIIGSRSALEGERKLVTVLFADVADYTSISEKLDPEEVHQIMDGCFNVLMDEIHRYEGTIDKFTGDGVMALFGAPVAHEDHAQRACYAALAIQRAIGEYGQKVEKECGVQFKMRVGLNSGPVIVGSIGNDLRMEYTAIGDTTNLASRMEGRAEPGTVLVSGDTHRLARDFFEFEPLGRVEVKGKGEAVETYRLIEAGGVETRFEAAVARGLTRFVGRRREMESLAEAFEKARSGSGQVVGVVGEAGVGKSRLVLELRQMLPKDEYSCLEGRCLHYGGSMAYLPILDMLRCYFDIKEGDREYVVKKKMKQRVDQVDHNLEGVLPPLQDILSLEVEDEEYLKLDPPLRRDRIFEALRDVLLRESQNRPLVLVVEDLHWIDRTSEDFLSYLIGWLANVQILLVLVYRPEYTHRWASKSYYSQIGVGQLSAPTSAELVQSILEEGEVVPEIRELILSRAAGNPLFMEEFTHALLENGSIRKKDRQYVLGRQASDIHVPDTIEGIISARMDRLEENLKRTMQVASVIGRDFAFRILQTITGMREELKAYLVNLQGLEFIYEKSLFPELEYIFKHALTQEVAYNSLLLRRRREIHQRIGGAIEELYPDRLEEFYEMLAYHYSRSDDSEKAYHYLRLSGDRAVRTYSNWEAFRFYREAINLLKQMPETEENRRRGVEVRIVIDWPMMALGYPENSLELLQDGKALASDLGDEWGLAQLCSIIGCCCFFRGDFAQGLEHCQKAFELAQKMGDIGLTAPTAFDLSQSYVATGEFCKTLELLPGVIAMIESAAKEAETFGRGFNIYSQLMGQHGYAMGMLGDFDQAEEICERAYRYAQQIGDLNSLAWTTFFPGWLACLKGDAEKGLERLQDLIGYCEEGQIAVAVGYAWMALGFAYYLLGDLDAAREHLDKGRKVQTDMGNPVMLSQHYYLSSLVHLDSGELEKARLDIEKALSLSRENGEKQVEAMTRCLQGMIVGTMDSSQRDEAQEAILDGIRMSDELRLRPLTGLGYFYLGELHGNTGQKQRALEALEKAQGMFQEMGMDYWAHRTEKAMERLEEQSH
jgi:class 3 adenylate cyclase/tetratricopeptide (TPR) repeat protein